MARILNCTICITLCYFLYCSSIATYREDINRGVVRKHVQGAAGLENNREKVVFLGVTNQSNANLQTMCHFFQPG